MNFWDTPITEVMTQPVIQVDSTDKITDAVLNMVRHNISAVPVIGESGRCIGVFSGQDLIKYESIREAVENELKHGYYYDIAHYGIEDRLPISQIRLDQVGYHVNRNFIAAKPGDTIAELAKRMCQEHSLYAMIMEADSNPIGMVSTLDMLACGLKAQRSTSVY